MVRGKAIWTLTVLIVSSGLVVFPEGGEAHHYEERPLQPGGMVAAFDWSWCTLNLVFTDGEGGVYIGSAAHCFSSVGEPVFLHGIGEVGTIVLRDFVPWMDDSGEPYKDFALIKVHPEHHDLVNPAGRFWGGPSGIETEFEPGTLIVGYGQGLGASATEPTRSRIGVLNHAFQDGANNPENEGRFEGWFAATYAAVGGDSGGFLLTGEGKAVGVIDWVAPATGEDGYVLGPTFKQILKDLEAAGFGLEVQTAPFNGDDALALAAAGVSRAEHCLLDPGVGSATSNACVREAVPWPWDADVRWLGEMADPDEPAVREDWRERSPYDNAIGVAIETPAGVVGAGTNVRSTSGYAKSEAAGVTVSAVDDSRGPVFFTVCIHRETAPGHCSEHAADNTVRSGIDQVTIRDEIPAGTWIAVYVYTLFAPMEGDSVKAVSGLITWSFEAA